MEIQLFREREISPHASQYQQTGTVGGFVQSHIIQKRSEIEERK